MAWRPGGEAGKLGNRYEAKWVVRQCVRLLREEIRSITLEAIGDDNDGVDVWVTSKDGARTAYQCKGRHHNNNQWSIGSLTTVIVKAYRQLHRDSSVCFRLVSPLPFTCLTDLTDNARKDLKLAPVVHLDYLCSISTANRDLIGALQNKIGGDGDECVRKQRTLDFLRRFDLEYFGDHAAEHSNLMAWLDQTLTGDSGASFAVLRDYVESHLAEPISVSTLVGYLSEKGIHTKQLAYDDRIVPAISILQEEFFASIIPDLINALTLGRKETQQVLNLIPEGRIILLKGAAGCGKSGVLYEVASELKNRNIPFLPLRLDRRPPSDCTRSYGDSMGLPDSPALCLAAISEQQPCVLILDQLDALRWTSGACNAAFEVCTQLVKQCREQSTPSRPVSVILSVRQVDLDNHPGLKSWLGGNPTIASIDIPSLTEQELEVSLKRFQENAFNQLSARQKTSLQSPHLLHMWMTISRDDPDVRFQSGTSLIRCYWADRKRRAIQLGANERDLTEFLDLIVTDMDRNNRIWSPSRLAERYTLPYDLLQSVGVLRESANKILFAHQSYLDYQVASRVLSELSRRHTLVEWLGKRENQHLLKREQLKLVLSQLAEEEPDKFADECDLLVQSPNVRFHLKHLVLAVIAQDVPTPRLSTIVMKWLSVQDLADRVLDTVFWGHPKWISVLDEKGVLVAWIDSKDSALRHRALNLLKSVASIDPERVVKHIRRIQAANPSDTDTVVRMLPFSVGDKAGHFLPIRLDLLERGVIQHYFDWHHLGQSFPREAIAYFKFFLSKVHVTKSNSSSSPVSWKLREPYQKCFDHMGEYGFDGLASAADAYPAELWNSCIDLITQLSLPLNPSISREDIQCSFHTYNHEHELMVCAVRLLIIAGIKRAQTEGANLFHETTKYHDTRSPITDLILAEAYSELPSECSDEVLDWLLAVPARLTASEHQEGVSKWQAASNLIKKHAATCSDRVFHSVEQFLVFYKPPKLIEKVKRCLEWSREGFYSAFWGNDQHALLTALPTHRISQFTQGLVGTLERRHAKYPFDSGVRLSAAGGWVVSPVHDKADHLSDKTWLRIIQSGKTHKDGFRTIRQVAENHVVKSDVESFAGDFRKVAKKNPTRFIKLSMAFPSNTNLRYIEAVASAAATTKPEQDSELSGMKGEQWAPATCADCVQFWERFFPLLENTYTVRDFFWMMQKRSEADWPNHFYEWLARLAVSHADPAVDADSYKYRDQTIETASPSVLASTALNSVRGVAAETIANILWEKPEKLSVFRDAIEQLVRDPHPAVRQSALHLCDFMLKYDQDQAVTWFCEACRLDPRVPSARIAIHFFNQTIPKYLPVIEPIIRSMLASPFDKVAQEGAAEVTARYLFHGCFENEYQWIRQSGTLAHKKGVVEAATALAQQPIYFERCVSILCDYRDEMEQELRNSAHRWITEKVLSFANAPQCLERYVTDSILKSDNYLLHHLKKHKASILPFRRVIMKFVDHLTAHLQTATEPTEGWRFHGLSGVLLRLYEESQAARDSECVGACLDAWDRLFEAGFERVRDLSNELSSYLPQS